ncbi:MAG TPA: hypothetical protein VFX02_13710 [Gammaproteobacteria bacterium]|nr:hypothetical protein [Gammaproteobacteria bacterium]
MNKGLSCWKCGAELKGVILPLSRRELCAACGADQHVCKLCRHYDLRVADMCREDRAEQVSDKERANFCDYFDPMPGAYKPAQAAGAAAAQRQLAELFGESAASDSGPAADKDKARAELEKLFGGDKSGR